MKGEGKDVKINVYEAELSFIEEWPEKLVFIETLVIAVEYADTKNAIMEIASAAMEDVIDQENCALFNILTLCVCGGFNCSFRVAKD